jgi:hypothetical protein
MVEALAEHYAISKTPLARGLKVINTDRATVPMRWVRFHGLYDGRLIALGKRYTPKAVF